MEKRIRTLQQPNAIEDWRQIDEPTSDLYRLTGSSRNKKLRKPEEYRGSADLRWQGPAPHNYEAERCRCRLVKDELAGWLDGYQWDWFSTYTLNMQPKPDTAHTMFRNHLGFIAYSGAKHPAIPAGRHPVFRRCWNRWRIWRNRLTEGR